jgi:hypothetical protein
MAFRLITRTRRQHTPILGGNQPAGFVSPTNKWLQALAVKSVGIERARHPN